VEKRRRDPETLRLRSIAPNMTVNDLERSKAFYTDVLGFIVKDRWTDDAGTLRGLTLQAGVCELNLSQDDWAKGRDRKKGVGVRIMGETAQDVDALAARVKAAGLTLAHEPRDEWGVRAFSIDDPDGYHITLYRTL
jgi:catechol 2,3-dioxygenase-like lactoylglutathione lyase family enzyme